MKGRLVLDYDCLGYGVWKPISNQTGTTCLGFGDEENLGVCKIMEKPRAQCQDDQIGATLLAPAASTCYVARSCGCNAHNAMCNRHGVKRNPVTASLVPFQKLLSEHVPVAAGHYAQHIAEYGGEWIRKWPEAKQKLIRESQAIDEIKPHKVKNMVKREIYPKPPTKARCIQFYPNLATQAEFGPEFTSLQKAWGKTMQRAEFGTCKVTFASGMNAKELGEWLSDVLQDYRDPWFYERDGKNWDSTLGAEAQAVKDQAYEFAGDAFCTFVHNSSIVEGLGCYKNGRLKYKLNFTTKSGHNDTTLGNNIVNAAITVMSFQGRKCDIIVAGDDLLVIVEGDFDCDAIVEREKAYGIKPEAYKYHHYEDVSFISGLFATTNDGKILFVPKPGRLIQRLFWTVHPPPPKRVRGYRRGVALGLLPTCGGMPIIGDWLRSYDDGSTVYRSGNSWKVWMYGEDAVTGELDNWFMRRYGLTKSEIAETTEIFVARAHEPVIVRTHVTDRLIMVDTCELDEREAGY